MSQLILCVLLALQGGPPHAELHPANADLYLAVPDIQGIVAAYGAAPMLQTVHDPALAGFLAGAGLDGTLEEDPRGQMRTWMDRLVPGAGALVDTALAFSLSFTMDGEGEELFGFELVASFASAPDALAAQKLALESGTPVAAEAVAGLPGLLRFTNAELGDMQLWCAPIGERCVLGGGAVSATGLAARLAGTDPGLDGSELLARARKEFGAGTGTTVCWLLQKRSPLELLSEANQAGEVMGGSMLSYDVLPSFLDPLSGQRALRMQLRGIRFATEMISPASAGSALGAEPLQPAWLQRVPADAMFVYSTSVDGAALGPKLRELFAFLGEAEDLDLAPAVQGLGPGMAFYMFPLSSIGAPQTHVWFDADDSAAVAAGVKALCAKLALTQPGISTSTRDYKVKGKDGERRPFPVTTITLPPGMLEFGPMFPTSPSFAEVEGGILFGLSSMHVKRELKRIYGQKDSAVDPITANGFGIPADTRSIVYMDWGMQIEAVLTLAKALGGMAGDMVPFDLTSLPDAKAFTKYLRPTYHVSRATPEGTYRYHEASFGPETWLAIAGLWMFGLEDALSGPSPQPIRGAVR